LILRSTPTRILPAGALAEHRFFKPEEANDFLTFENLIAPSGRLPLNTSGGNLAECYMHGFELVLEAVCQVRGSFDELGCVRCGTRYEIEMISSS
jgi:hypothetical protein